jgi:hypothetical protein
MTEMLERVRTNGVGGTTEHPSVVQLIARVMQDVRSVGKADTNSHFGFKFRGIDTVLDAVGPALRKHGVVVVPELRERLMAVVDKKQHVHVTVAYTFYGPGGDHITAVVPGEAMDQQDKAVSKAMSVAFRTALIQALSLATGERDPHAGDPISRKLIQLQQQVKAAGAAKGLTTMQALRDDYAEWSQGAEIEVADESDLRDYLKYLNPQGTKTMQRRQQPAGRAAGTN